IFPRSYGGLGAEAYRAILGRRLEIKAAAKAATSRAERRRIEIASYGLKIILNSTFGKFGSQYSSMFDPEAMLGVTLSGQLLLVDLIERLDQVGAEVLSANTDSAIFRTRRDDERWRQVLADWERDTAMVMDVDSLDTVLLLGTNIYATRDLKGKIKRRGAGLKGNPDPEKVLNSPVVADAVVAALFDGVPPETTVVAEQNLARFCAVVRTSSKVAEAVLVDDATGRETPLGKITRWYKVAGSKLRIVHRMLSGRETTPAKATGITLAQDLTDATIPPDLDLDHYIAEARKAVNAVSGDHRLNPSLIPDHGPARGALDRGLVPFPLLDGGALPPGADPGRPTYLWDWFRYPAVGTLTGPAWGVLAVTVADPAKFRSAVEQLGIGLLERPWASLEGALVSCDHGVDPAAVRSGEAPGTLLFRFQAETPHPLTKPLASRRETLGVLAAYGQKGRVPAVAGRVEAGEELGLDGALGPPPEWLVDLFDPAKTTARGKTTKPRKKAGTRKTQRVDPTGQMVFGEDVGGETSLATTGEAPDAMRGREPTEAAEPAPWEQHEADVRPETPDEVEVSADEDEVEATADEEEPSEDGGGHVTLFADLRDRISIPDLLREYGIEVDAYDRCKCPIPSHDHDPADSNPSSFSAAAGDDRWHCYARGEGGDVTDLERELGGHPDNYAAARALAGRYPPLANGKPTAGSNGKPRRAVRAPTYPTLEDALAAAGRIRWRGGDPFGKPAILYPYPDADGRVNAYVARFERRTVVDGKPKREKEFRPISLHPD
ncbi:MAG: hypothetical protein JO075_14955, partial [Acidimicrobiia bacterium]|nr:hypothetical protein [Acidimicrobiia bacterium]